MIINNKSINLIESIDGKFENLPLKSKYEWFYEIYAKHFINEYNELIELKKCERITKDQLWDLNQYQILNTRFINFLDILGDIVESEQSINEFFSKNKRLNISRASFFREMKRFSDHLKKKVVNFKNLFHKSTKPIKIQYKYTSVQRKAISRYINQKLEDSKTKGEFFNKTTLWLRIRKDGVLHEYGDFSTISNATISKIYKEENGISLVLNKCFNKKHKPRQHVKMLGNIQLDLKVLGKSETSVGKYVYVFDMIDISSRLVYSRVLPEATVSEVIKCLNNGLVFYKKHGINVRSIQTDNAMMFKKTNFITCNEFHRVLKVYGIKHRRISLGEPQSNGCVERFHLKIDKEAHFRLRHCKTIQEVGQVISEYMIFHNNDRYHYYYEFSKPGNKLPYANRFMKPIDAIKVIPCYYKNNQSQMSM